MEPTKLLKSINSLFSIDPQKQSTLQHPPSAGFHLGNSLQKDHRGKGISGKVLEAFDVCVDNLKPKKLPKPTKAVKGLDNIDQAKLDQHCAKVCGFKKNANVFTGAEKKCVQKAKQPIEPFDPLAPKKSVTVEAKKPVEPFDPLAPKKRVTIEAKKPVEPVIKTAPIQCTPKAKKPIDPVIKTAPKQCTPKAKKPIERPKSVNVQAKKPVEPVYELTKVPCTAKAKVPCTPVAKTKCVPAKVCKPKMKQPKEIEMCAVSKLRCPPCRAGILRWLWPIGGFLLGYYLGGMGDNPPPPTTAKVEPAKVKPAKVEPAKVEPPKVEPVKVEPLKVEPPKVEPLKVKPAKVEPAKVEPVKVIIPKVLKPDWKEGVCCADKIHIYTEYSKACTVEPVSIYR